MRGLTRSNLILAPFEFVVDFAYRIGEHARAFSCRRDIHLLPFANPDVKIVSILRVRVEATISVGARCMVDPLDCVWPQTTVRYEVRFGLVHSVHISMRCCPNVIETHYGSVQLLSRRIHKLS